MSTPTPKISEAEIDFYRTHPEMFEALGDKATIHRIILLIAFAVGVLLVVASKSLKYGFADSEIPWLVEITVDLVFELGIALWGGVATTVLLQDLVKRQYREGRRYQHEIIRQITEQNDETSSNA